MTPGRHLSPSLSVFANYLPHAHLCRAVLHHLRPWYLPAQPYPAQAPCRDHRHHLLLECDVRQRQSRTQRSKCWDLTQTSAAASLLRLSVCPGRVPATCTQSVHSHPPHSAALSAGHMWQLAHSQSSGHLSCCQLAVRCRNNILGHLYTFLVHPDLSSRIPFRPTKEPGCVLPWASPACVSRPCSALGAAGICLHAYIRTKVRLCSWKALESVCYWVSLCV